jgi:aminoglycoside phosphotransferase (APT) family kinase protein
MFDRAETAALYARLGGATLDDLAWYEALAGYRFGIILARMSLRSLAYAQQELPADPNDLIMFAPLLEQLLQDLS